MGHSSIRVTWTKIIKNQKIFFEPDGSKTTINNYNQYKNIEIKSALPHEDNLDKNKSCLNWSMKNTDHIREASAYSREYNELIILEYYASQNIKTGASQMPKGTTGSSTTT